VKVIFYTFKRR